MVATVFPADAVAGEPAYSGRELRQVHAPALAGATAARPLGARSGVRPGTSTTTVTATSTVWTVKPFAGVIDGEAAVEAGPYWFAFDTNTTGAVTAANATNPRIDIVYVRVDDPAEGDGTAAPAVAIGYLAGTAAASPVAPPTPARSFAIANINVPASGGGSPSVTWVAPYTVGAGGIIPVRSVTELNAVKVLGTAESPVYMDWGGNLYVCKDGSTLDLLVKQSALNGRAVSASGPASVGPFTSATALVTAPAVTGDGVRRFKITAMVRNLSGTVANDLFAMSIVEVNSGTNYSGSCHVIVQTTAAGVYSNAVTITAVATPAAGTRIFRLDCTRSVGTGSGTAFDPVIIVEQIN